MTYEEILEKIIAIIADCFDEDIDNLSEDTNFINDLSLDEEQYEELSQNIKMEIGITVTQDIFDDCTTVGDLASYIEDEMDI